jgi:hypothetical protein
MGSKQKKLQMFCLLPCYVHLVGSREVFLIDSMNTFGADSLTARLASIFKCSAERYVIAVYLALNSKTRLRIRYHVYC